MPKLSIIIICKNEAHQIEACLRSVSWADEIIVLDSGSTDNTVELAKQFTEKVYETDWPGFGPQKNRALEKATGDWLLSLDADEVVTPELKIQIKSIIEKDDSHCVYAIRRLSSYCGKRIHFGSWRKDFVTRLFKKGSARFTNDRVHEHLKTEQAIGKIHAPLLHEAFQTLEEVLEKVNLYSTLGAHQRLERGRKKASLRKALSHAFWHFFYTYIIRLGFLDGREGFLLAVSNAEGIYYRYLKLTYLVEKNRHTLRQT